MKRFKPSLETILNATVDHMNVSIDDVRSDTRSMIVMMTRDLFCHLAVRFCYSWYEIENFLGRRCPRERYGCTENLTSYSTTFNVALKNIRSHIESQRKMPPASLGWRWTEEEEKRMASACQESLKKMLNYGKSAIVRSPASPSRKEPLCRILEMMANNPEVDLKEISYRLGIHYQTVQRIARESKEIRRVKSGNKYFWLISDIHHET